MSDRTPQPTRVGPSPGSRAGIEELNKKWAEAASEWEKAAKEWEGFAFGCTLPLVVWVAVFVVVLYVR